MESCGAKSEDGGQPRGKNNKSKRKKSTRTKGGERKKSTRTKEKERKKSTRTKGGEVEEMASFGIFLHLAILCFFTVRYDC